MIKKLILVLLVMFTLVLFACKDSKEETGKTAFQVE